MNRRTFCRNLLAIPGVTSIPGWAQLFAEASKPISNPACWSSTGQLHFILNDLLDHPFYWWPRTLLTYPIRFEQLVDLDRLVLTRMDTGEKIPIQFSNVTHGAAGVESATLNFFSDLPSGARREFVLKEISSPAAPAPPQVSESHDDNTIVLDSGVMRVRIPASQLVTGDAPGPILQLARDTNARNTKWIGDSVLSITGDRVIRITTRIIERGPLFIAYEIAYESAGGSRYIARMQLNGGFDFVRFQEDMEGMRPGGHGLLTTTWKSFNVTHRQAPNHPFPLPPKVLPYEQYHWERIDETLAYNPVVLPEGQLPFNLGIYQTWTAFHSDTSANFWDERSGDALGIFIDKPAEWQDHEYANHTESETIQVRYHYQDGRFYWRWPITRGARSSCIGFYDHEKDKQAMRQLEHDAQPVERDGFSYRGGRAYTSHAMFLQNRFNTLDLNAVKDWVLEYPDDGHRPPVLFETGMVKDAGDLERRIMTSEYIGTLPLLGTRENGGMGPIPGRSIVNFSPVPSRQIQLWWIDAFNRLSASMTERQRRRLTAMYLFIAYVHAGDDFMPLIPMLSGHPNFLADVKAQPGAMAFLLPDHPMARAWAALWQKSVELNTRYNTRPAVEQWDAHGGRWTENLGTYVWAFLRPSLRTEFLLRHFDGHEHFLSPQLAAMADWLVNALSAPFDGETPQAYHDLQTLDQGHEWGALAPGKGPRRVHPPQGAHSDRRVPPRSMWYLGACLRNYAPMAAEHAMWAARPTNQDMETKPGEPSAWDAMYRTPDNRGTNPHLRSRKYTGYGIVLRAAVDTANEVSVHLQQIDQGPNYRWGQASEGGCGVIYYFAQGKSWSYNGSEDVGDRDDQDTDFCTNFGVFLDGQFRAIGMNVLSRPMYDLGCGQFAEITSREDSTAYSWPEYASRSVLLAGHDYFVVYDRVMNPSVRHRLTWFVRRGDQMPALKLLRGAEPRNETKHTEVNTEASTGMWFDGVGDSMTLVSHRQDIEAEVTPFGCRVRAADIDDLVFRNPQPIQFSENGFAFEGTDGIIRRANGRIEFALFHGTRIAVPGLAFSTADTDLGISATIATGQSSRGCYYAPRATSVSIAATSAAEKNVFYIDGAPCTARRESGKLTVDLPAGRHSWEITDRLPVPVAPLIERTENRAGAVRVFASAVASATQYRFEISTDSGAKWTAVATAAQPHCNLTGLLNESKLHVRATAINDRHASEPGPEYPIYVTDQPPPAPDGLHVDLRDAEARITWGELLGITEYRLYARSKTLDASKNEFQLVYRGRDRSYVYRHPGIRVSNPAPGKSQTGTGSEIVEFCVTAANGNGEGQRSPVADTDPASWQNWDPKPGEPFRRVSSFPPDSPPSESKWPRYYPA